MDKQRKTSTSKENKNERDKKNVTFEEKNKKINRIGLIDYELFIKECENYLIEKYPEDKKKQKPSLRNIANIFGWITKDHKTNEYRPNQTKVKNLSSRKVDEETLNEISEVLGLNPGYLLGTSTLRYLYKDNSWRLYDKTLTDNDIIDMEIKEMEEGNLKEYAPILLFIKAMGYSFTKTKSGYLLDMPSNVYENLLSKVGMTETEKKIIYDNDNQLFMNVKGFSNAEKKSIFFPITDFELLMMQLKSISGLFETTILNYCVSDTLKINQDAIENGNLIV